MAERIEEEGSVTFGSALGPQETASFTITNLAQSLHPGGLAQNHSNKLGLSQRPGRAIKPSRLISGAWMEAEWVIWERFARPKLGRH